MRLGGALLSKALGAAAILVRPGITLKDLDDEAERVIRAGGGEPSFKGYSGDSSESPFPSTMCVSVNEELVHGAGNRPVALQEGDIVSLDIGCWYKGLCTDMAVTVPVGKISKERQMLLKATREALEKAVSVVHVGGYIHDVGHAVESVIKPYGFGIVRALVGHGVGHAIHEAPHVPNFVDPNVPKVRIRDGMCIAIEPMISLSQDYRVKTSDDGWTVVMADKAPAAHFEMTVAITKAGTEILTPLPQLVIAGSLSIPSDEANSPVVSF